MGGKKSNSELERLVKDHEGIVYHLVSRILLSLPTKHDRDDLIGYGMLGLLEAAQAFCPLKKTKFSTFAFLRIRGAIYDGISETSWMSRYQYRKHLQRLRKEQEKTQAAECADADQSENFDETKETLKPSENNYSQANLVSLTTEHMGEVEDPQPSVYHLVMQHEMEALLVQAVAKLSTRDNLLITMVYFENRTLQEAADRIGVSKSWASRLHQNIIEQLGFELGRPKRARQSKSIDTEKRQLKDEPLDQQSVTEKVR